MNEDLMTRHPDQANARGGTELMQERIYNSVPRELLEKFQIWFSRYDESRVDPTKIQLLYVHDLPGDPMYDKTLSKEGRERFARIIFVSNWQMQQFINYYGLPWSRCVVLSNAIDPIDIHAHDITEKFQQEETHVIYHTTPHRGLNILIGVWPLINQHFPKAHLHVYSSFKVYGWDARDTQYKPLYDAVKQLPNATYYGAVSNEEIRDVLKKMHIFAYPSTWLETSCLALIEAMSAGLMSVHPNYGALFETSGGITGMYQWVEDINQHAGAFFNTLAASIEYKERDPAGTATHAIESKIYADSRYNMRYRAQHWTQMLSVWSER